MDALNQRIVLVTRKTRLEDLIVRFNTIEQARFYVEHLGADFSDYEAEHRVYLEAVQGIDPKVLQALMVGQADPSVLIAQAFQGLAEGAGRIGELNISPDLLQQLTQPRAKLPAKA